MGGAALPRASRNRSSQRVPYPHHLTARRVYLGTQCSLLTIDGTRESPVMSFASYLIKGLSRRCSRKAQTRRVRLARDAGRVSGIKRGCPSDARITSSGFQTSWSSSAIPPSMAFISSSANRRPAATRGAVNVVRGGDIKGPNGLSSLPMMPTSRPGKRPLSCKVRIAPIATMSLPQRIAVGGRLRARRRRTPAAPPSSVNSSSTMSSGSRSRDANCRALS